MKIEYLLLVIILLQLWQIFQRRTKFRAFPKARKLKQGVAWKIENAWLYIKKYFNTLGKDAR